MQENYEEQLAPPEQPRIQTVTGKLMMVGPLILHGKDRTDLMRALTIGVTDDARTIHCRESMTLYLEGRQALANTLQLGALIEYAYYTTRGINIICSFHGKTTEPRRLF